MAAPAPPTHVRPATAADAAAIAAIYAPAVTDNAASFEEAPPDAREIAARIAKVSARHAWLVAERAGEVLGYAYGGPHRERAAYRWSVEVSAYIRADAHRQGLARRLYTELFARLAALGYVNAYAGITLPNAASVGLHEALGFTKIGVYHGIGFKFGRWHDVGWWERRLPAPNDPPREPGPV